MDPVSSEIGDLLHFMNPAKWLPSLRSVILKNFSDTFSLVDLFDFAFEHWVLMILLVGNNVVTNLPTTNTGVRTVSTASNIVDVYHWTLVPDVFTILTDKVFSFTTSDSFLSVFCRYISNCLFFGPASSHVYVSFGIYFC